MRIFSICIWLLWASVLVSDVSAAPSRPSTMEMEMDISVRRYNAKTKQSATETGHHKLWVKGQRVRRLEETVLGTRILLEGGGEQYILSPDSKRGIKQKIARPIERLNYPEYFDKAGLMAWLKDNGAKKSSSETIGNVACDLYIQTEQELTIRRWIRPDNLLPVKIEVKIRGPLEVTQTVQVKSIKVGEALSDNLFRAPADYKVQSVQRPSKATPGKRGK